MAAPIIAEVINDIGRDDMKELKSKLREAYPFGLREYHPYKIWLDEIKRQLGTKPPLGSRCLLKTRCPETEDLFKEKQ